MIFIIKCCLFIYYHYYCTVILKITIRNLVQTPLIKIIGLADIRQITENNEITSNLRF